MFLVILPNKEPAINCHDTPQALMSGVGFVTRITDIMFNDDLPSHEVRYIQKFLIGLHLMKATFL